ncbi:uncharacterized protein BDW43DRAFT_133237 [Aspergillus alliaceus]|uniref:uncharacterized protein n=1 Tax=Petromyces alliaceus TaxID=209559 RepID=UPI0012A5F244|nr:uncharacterized protein BDW43DRAFT_133237 [Aspergillus alliaceus]KAB8231783.1 hypothetical protein BDW43DRAFT_133237 [Aspergillus alliaceus]
MSTLDNGHASEGIGKIVGIKEVPSNARKTNLFRWTLGLVVRLCIWFILLTPFFRCPSQLSNLNDSSPRVCKPYLVARSYIEPHVLPYYSNYGAPYVEKARPYVLVINEKVYTPAANVAKLGYDKYGAPALDKAQTYGSQQWEKQVVPLLQTARDATSELYSAKVAPHVQRATAIVSPYYQKANSAFHSACVNHVQPFLARSRPFIGKTYTSGQNILTTTVVPYAQNTWSSVVYFMHSWLWPRVTGLYSANVEPQLVKIGQRLASYREGKQLRNVVDEVDSSSTKQESVTSVVLEATKRESLTSTSTVVASSTPHTLSPTEITAQTREKIESDLRTWQEKFAVAADKGFEDLEERLYELVDDYVNGGAKKHGERLVMALETVVQQELQAVKFRMGELTEALPSEQSPAEEAAQTALSKDIRQAAVAIRDCAHAIREWHSSFDQELVRHVSAAVNSTIDVLDSVRDLGLQEIGIRWALMDGVTYKDWAKYHALKAQFEDWKNKFREVGLRHAKLEDARALSDYVLSRGMDAAEGAAKELARLRDVGRWKIAAREVSDNFDTRSGSPPSLPKLSDQSGVDASSSMVRGTTEFEGQTLGLDDAPLENEYSSLEDEGSPNKEPESSNFPAESADNIQRSPLTAQQTDGEEEVDPTTSSWGVAAAQILPEHDVSDDGKAPEKLYSALNQAREQYVEATRSAEANSFQSLHPEVGDQATRDQLTDTTRQAPNFPSPHYEAVENLVSDLLSGKDPLYVQNFMEKLHAIYGSSVPAPPELQREIVADYRRTSTSSSPATHEPLSQDDVENRLGQSQSAIRPGYEQATPVESAAGSDAYSESPPTEPVIPLESTQEQDINTGFDANTFASEASEATTSHLQNSDDYLEDTPTRDDL